MENGDTACIEWAGARDRQDYGITFLDGKVLKASRAAWNKAHGSIPDGLCVLHCCDNPPCHNVEHLFLGTRGDNNRDAASKGRSRNGHMGATHCKRNHLFDEANTYVTPKGQRRCRQCKREAARRGPRWGGGCKNGHDLAETGYTNPKTGRRACKECVNAWRRERRRTRAAVDVGSHA